MPASSFVIRDHAGGAVDTTIVSGISAIDLSITLTSSTGWPTGGVNGPFYVIVDYDVAGKEKIEIASRTGTTLTIADTGKRGIDGTSAATHTAGATIRHVWTALEADEANEHLGNTGLDHHTQYLNTARHAAITHTSAMLGTDSVGSDEIAADAVGTSEIAPLAVTSAELATDAVTNAKVANDAINTSEILNNAITTAKVADLQITSAKLASAAAGPGKIGTGAVDNPINIVDGIITLAKLASEDPTNYDASSTFTNPTGNFTLGAGGVRTARYFAIGKLRLMLFHFTLGTGGNVVGGGTLIEVGLPNAAHGSIRGFCAARVRDVSTGSIFSGTGVIAAGTSVATNFATAGASATWDGLTPFDWTDGDSLDGIAVWITA